MGRPYASNKCGFSFTNQLPYHTTPPVFKYSGVFTIVNGIGVELKIS
jgi:hypothetical protein